MSRHQPLSNLNATTELLDNTVLAAFVRDFVQPQYRARLLYLAERPKRHSDVVHALVHSTDLGILRADQVTPLAHAHECAASVERRLLALGGNPPCMVLDWLSWGCLPLPEAVAQVWGSWERILYSPAARLALFTNHDGVAYILHNRPRPGG